MLEKSYDPRAVEARISEAWEDAGAFRCGREERLSAEPYTIVIPPPNVTGSLHMGHALNNTLQDVLCRFERMRGRDVLWQPGTDHAGIATQMVVERQMAERQEPNRRTIGREKFLEKVWAWKEESGGTIINQLKRLGASCDWSRERFTMDEGLSQAVLKVFVELYRAGLIYKDKRLVNWDPAFETAISDLEVIPTEVKGHIWHFKYPLKDDPAQYITVATTRPETMLGDTAVAVHPEDERYRHLVGKTVVLPLVGREIAIVADEYSDPEKGSGAVKITPAHDFNDFEVGRRHNLEMINIFDTKAALNENVPEVYRGLDRFEARRRIVADLDALGLLDKIEDHVHMVPHAERGAAIVEPYLTDQWYVDAKTMAQPAIKAVRDGRTRFVPERYANDYFRWLEEIQPWCISRQLWWGHQIPAWYGPDGEIFVAEDSAAAGKAAAAHYGRPVTLVRDEDVLDTWFSSALWPFSTLGWPQQTAELGRYYPTNTLVTGFDIIFFWVARMMMTGLHFMDEVPFHDVYIHALVRDEKGQKMSKSKGNVIDPLELIDQYGADALRFTLTAMAAQGRDIKLSTQRVEGYRNFATKIWNAARFAEMNEAMLKPDFDPASLQHTVNRWIAGETQRAVSEVTADLEAFRFNEAAGTAYEFVWGIFCDWYLELIKPILNGDDQAAIAETRATIAWTFDEILKLLHPFMPFITEELWERTAENGIRRDRVLALSAWPALRGLEDGDAAAEIGWVVKLVSEIRSVRSEMNVPAGAKIALQIVAASELERERLNRHEGTVSRLARLSNISFVDVASKGAAAIVFEATTAALPLQGVIDLDAEAKRLAKEIDKARSEIAKIDSKLANPKFVERAPLAVVEENRERRQDFEGQVERFEAALKRLEAAA
ncbi:MAG: valine--tRNA ligase [Alphaproteobacteria bacterium]|nr:valine--tRNA ligase [Alphaproteobacteria bacterium]